MALNGRLNHNGMLARDVERTKSLGHTEQSVYKKDWKISKPKMSKDVKIVDDVETESSNLPKLAIEKSDSLSLQANENNIRIASPAVISQKNESLTVPGALPGSSDTSDEQKLSLNDSLSLNREGSRLSLKSSRSIDSRIRNAIVQMPPGTEETEKTVLDPEESWIRTAIPHLPLGLAIVCLVMNICIPGTGTMLSGFFIFCGGKSRIPSKTETDVIVTLCVNIWVGVSQLFTVSFLLVGWFWSFAWGIKIVILSVEWRKEKKLERARQLQTFALSAFGTNVSGRRT